MLWIVWGVRDIAVNKTKFLFLCLTKQVTNKWVYKIIGGKLNREGDIIWGKLYLGND